MCTFGSHKIWEVIGILKMHGLLGLQGSQNFSFHSIRQVNWLKYSWILPVIYFIQKVLKLKITPI